MDSKCGIIGQQGLLEEVGHCEYSNILEKYTGSGPLLFCALTVVLALPQNVPLVRWMETMNLPSPLKQFVSGILSQ